MRTSQIPALTKLHKDPTCQFVTMEILETIDRYDPDPIDLAAALQYIVDKIDDHVSNIQHKAALRRPNTTYGGATTSWRG